MFPIRQRNKQSRLTLKCIVFFILACFGLFCVLKNVNSFLKFFGNDLAHAFLEASIENSASTYYNDADNPFIRLTMKHFRSGDNVFYWNSQIVKSSLWVPIIEARAGRLNFRLNPVNISYMDDRELLFADLAICEFFDKRPFELRLESLGLDKKIFHIDDDAKYLLYSVDRTCNNDLEKNTSMNNSRIRKTNFASSAFGFMEKIFRLALALGLISAAGMPIARFAAKNLPARGISTLLPLSFCFGTAFYSLGLFLLGINGFPLNLANSILTLTGIFLIGLFLPTQFPQSCENNTEKESSATDAKTAYGKSAMKLLSVAGLTLAIALFTFLLASAVVLEDDSSPAQLVWGYKAKVIFQEKCLPFQLLTDETERYTHQNYPLSYPFLLSWCAECLGGGDMRILRLVPVFSSLLFFLSLQTIIRINDARNAFSTVASVCFCGSTTFIMCATRLYAETIYLLPLLWGLFFLMQGLSKSKNVFKCLLLGFALIGASAWVKNEGAVYFALSAIIVFLLKIRDISWLRPHLRQFFISIFIGFIVFMLPWHLTRYFIGIEDCDFAYIDIFNMSAHHIAYTLKISFSEIFEIIAYSPFRTCGVWLFFIFTILYMPCKELRKEKELFPLVLCLASIIFFSTVFIFSTKDLNWHVHYSMIRLMLVPEMLAWILIVGTHYKHEN